jgi:FixJ family two-component response regulator
MPSVKRSSAAALHLRTEPTWVAVELGTRHSHRDRETMALVVSSLLNKQIARELGISEITVKAHRGLVVRKTQV